MRGKKNEMGGKEVPPSKPNAELAHNTMSLKDGTSILVGSERFRAAETLMDGIVQIGEEGVMSLPDAVGLAVELACHGEYAGRRADLWQHMVIVGGGARIKGRFHFNFEADDRIQRGIHSTIGFQIACADDES